MKYNTWARRFGKNLIFRRPRASFWIVSVLPTTRELCVIRANRNAAWLPSEPATLIIQA